MKGDSELIKDRVYYKYAQDVLDGKIVAGQLLKLACARFMKDIESDNIKLKCKKADEMMAFFYNLKVVDNKGNNVPFVLQPWQQFILFNLFCLYRVDTGNRKYRRAYIQVSRKNGKTALSAAICLYCLIADKVISPQVIFCASKLEQADNAIRMAKLYSQQLDPGGKLIKTYRGSIELKANDGKLWAISGDGASNDGSNVSACLIDEYHAHKNDELYQSLLTGMGQRANPLLMAISTAGSNLTSSCKAHRDYCVQVLQGEVQDESLFPLIYELDEGDDWESETNWIKACPNYGVTVQKQFMLDQINLAKNDITKRDDILTKQLNIWCPSTNASYVSIDDLKKFTKKVNFNKLEGCDCYIGVDLSLRNDLTAVSYLMLDDDCKMIFKTDYYFPKSKLEDNPNKIILKDWAKRGYLKLTMGTNVNQAEVVQDIVNNTDNLNVQGIFYDKFQSSEFVKLCEDEGLPCVVFSQTLLNFNAPTKEFMYLVESVDTKKMTIDANPITLYCFDNVKLMTDSNGNIKPRKPEDPRRKIDGAIAMLQAYGGYLNSEDNTINIC